MTVTGDDLATLEGRPNVLSNLLVGGRLSDLGLHLLDPTEDLLVGETNKLVAILRSTKTYPWRGPARPFKAAA